MTDVSLLAFPTSVVTESFFREMESFATGTVVNFSVFTLTFFSAEVTTALNNLVIRSHEEAIDV